MQQYFGWGNTNFNLCRSLTLLMNDYLVEMFNRDDLTELGKDHPSSQNNHELNRATLGLKYITLSYSQY